VVLSGFLCGFQKTKLTLVYNYAFMSQYKNVQSEVKRDFVLLEIIIIIKVQENDNDVLLVERWLYCPKYF
jgi:hypothetical protein